RHQQVHLLDLKEEVLDPIRKFWNGAQRGIYDEARSFTADQKANFAYVGSEVSERIRVMLSDPRCFKGNSIQLLKSNLDGLRAELNSRLAEERATAMAEIEDLKAKLETLPEFSKLPEANRRDILKDADAAASRINSAGLIAMI